MNLVHKVVFKTEEGLKVKLDFTLETEEVERAVRNYLYDMGFVQSDEEFDRVEVCLGTGTAGEVIARCFYEEGKE